VNPAPSTAQLPKIEQARAVDTVHERLREAILSRQFASGQRLDVDGIAQQLGVSVTPVRSAIELLAAEGLVDVQPRSGTFVATLSAADVEETMDIRCALECLAAEKAAARLTDVDIAQARRLLKRLARPIRTDKDLREHENANLQLHNLIIGAADNRRLTQLYMTLNSHLTMARLHGRAADWRDRLKQEQSEHEEIVAAMERRDPKALADRMRQHILRAKQSLLHDMEESQ
jgi:DNA-binding GntR family transcriptional regulator